MGFWIVPKNFHVHIQTNLLAYRKIKIVSTVVALAEGAIWDENRKIVQFKYGYMNTLITII